MVTRQPNGAQARSNLPATLVSIFTEEQVDGRDAHIFMFGEQMEWYRGRRGNVGYSMSGQLDTPDPSEKKQLEAIYRITS